MGLAVTGSDPRRSRRPRDPVSENDPRNNLSWRVTQAERRLDRLEAHEPSVVSERVGMLSLRVGELRTEVAEDVGALRAEMRERDQAREKQIRAFQRIFVTVFSGVGIAVAVAVIAQIATNGTP